MAWEKRHIGFIIKKYNVGDKVPLDAIFLTGFAKVSEHNGIPYQYDDFYYQIPKYESIQVRDKCIMCDGKGGSYFNGTFHRFWDTCETCNGSGLKNNRKNKNKKRQSKRSKK